MTIRNASHHDTKAIQRLLGQLGYPEMADSDVLLNITKHQQQGYAILVAEVDSRVAGFVSMHWFNLFHRKGNIGRVSALCVDDTLRSKGVGRTLLSAAEELLSSNGCVRIELTSNMRRTRAHQFYLRQGYQEESKRFVKEIAPRKAGTQDTDRDQ